MASVGNLKLFMQLEWGKNVIHNTFCASRKKTIKFCINDLSAFLNETAIFWPESVITGYYVTRRMVNPPGFDANQQFVLFRLNGFSQLNAQHLQASETLQCHAAHRLRRRRRHRLRRPCRPRFAALGRCRRLRRRCGITRRRVVLRLLRHGRSHAKTLVVVSPKLPFDWPSAAATKMTARHWVDR